MNHPAFETRVLFLQAAVACFAEHGFSGASVRMIACRAKRPLSLLFHHFGTKDGLYLAVFEYMFETSLFFNRPDAPPAGGHTPRDPGEAAQILRDQIFFLYADVNLDKEKLDPIHKYGTRLLLQEIRDPRPDLVPLVSRYTSPITETFKQCIRVLRPDLDPAQVAFLGASILGAVVSHGFMLGMNKVLWTEAESSMGSSQASEWLQTFSLAGIQGFAKAD